MTCQIDAIGIVSATSLLTYDQYMAIVSHGVPENLGYLVKNAACRCGFEALMPGTKSVVCCALRMPELPEVLRPYLARFCAFGDYHAIVRERLTAFAEKLCQHYGVQNYRICVDSAPILERELAVRAGLGKIGHNRMVIHPELGSYVVLGEILVDVDLMAYESEIVRLSDKPSATEVSNGVMPGACGCCASGHRLCAAACPTGALTEDGYDFHRCLAYWTTQHRGEMPEAFALAMGACLWGCDRCQIACPRARGGQQKVAARMAQPRHSDAAGAYDGDSRIAHAPNKNLSTHDEMIKNSECSVDCEYNANSRCDDVYNTNPEKCEPVIYGLKWAEMLEMSAGQLRRSLANTAMGGAHPYMVQRNLCLVIGNLGFWHYEKQLVEVCRSHACEWVRSAAERALKRFEKGE